MRSGKKANPVLANGTKWCPACRAFKAVEQFNVDPRQPSGLKSYCKDCCRDSLLKHRYGINRTQYDAILAEQGGVCAICKTLPDEYKQGQLRFLVVDHNHATGSVRGLLHHRCNRLLGQAGDHPGILRAAATYLEGQA